MQSLIPVARRKSLSLTPLIDVVFILLLFFMLTSSFVKTEQLSLAAVVAAEQVEQTEVLRVLLRADGMLVDTNGKVLSDSDLRRHAESLGSAVLSPTASASVQQLINAFSRLNGIGMEAVAIGDTAAVGDAL